MLQPFDAKLLVIRRQRRLVLAGNADEWREIGALGRQFLGELEADAGGGTHGIKRIVEQREAMIVTHFFVLGANVGDLSQLKRQAHGIERRPPQGALRKAAPENDKRISLFVAVARALVGDVSDSRSTL